MDDKQKIESGLRLYEKITGVIPGFKGYKQKEVRRESDRLVRVQASANLSQALDLFKRSLATINLPISYDKMVMANEISARLDTVKEKTSKALGSYSGFFDAVKVKEEKLDQLLNIDYGLITQSKDILDLAVKISKVDFTNPEWKQLALEIKDIIDTLEESLRAKDRLLATA